MQTVFSQKLPADQPRVCLCGGVAVLPCGYNTVLH